VTNKKKEFTAAICGALAFINTECFGEEVNSNSPMPKVELPESLLCEETQSKAFSSYILRFKSKREVALSALYFDISKVAEYHRDMKTILTNYLESIPDSHGKKRASNCLLGSLSAG